MLPGVDVRRRAAKLGPEVWMAVACSAALLLYGNAVSSFPLETRERLLLWANLALMALLLAWALGVAGLTVHDLGLSPRHAPASAMVGGLLSLVVAAPPVLFISLVPLVNGEPVEAEGITDRSGAAMAYFILFRQPVGTALFEEVAFRGVLYGLWRRAGGDRAAFLATAATFALWHVVITSRTVAESGVLSSPPALAAGAIVSLAGLFAGGLTFAYLRWHTQSIAAAVVAHWLVVAAMAVTVWAAS